jgi:hypothetical protein
MAATGLGTNSPCKHAVLQGMDLECIVHCTCIQQLLIYIAAFILAGGTASANALAESIASGQSTAAAQALATSSAAGGAQSQAAAQAIAQAASKSECVAELPGCCAVVGIAK